MAAQGIDPRRDGGVIQRHRSKNIAEGLIIIDMHIDRYIDQQLNLNACTLDDFKTADASMQGCLEMAKIASQTDLPILIHGETGSGKTLLARAIHNSSKRAQGAFISFNAAALSDTLLDSQLFGHERGAFTGAEKVVKGKFELADKGTLFIDEIADMSTIAQSKILRAVEYGEFERLGSEKILIADVRLISATHLPLQSFMELDRFRKDLFYRLCGIRICIPPLRERPNDLRTLVAAEIVAANQKQGKSIDGLEKKAADRLFSYHWPGNLRELNRVINAAVAITKGDVIRGDAILIDKLELPGTSPEPESSGSAIDFDVGLSLEEVEQRYIRMVLEKMNGNKRQSARILGISRATLDRKLALVSR